jgi:hypothetical protein
MSDDPSMDDPAGDVTDENPFGLPRDHEQRWKECVYAARSCESTLQRLPDPSPGSDLARADMFYPWEKVSTWVRSYLRASAEHLCLWADVVAPYRFEPGAVNHVRVRPYLLLARAGLEAAAHALWLVEVTDAKECANRFLRLMHRDFNLHRKALEADNLDTSFIDTRIADLEGRVSEHSIPVSLTERVPGYQELIRFAATKTNHDADRWAYLWNAASGAAHGQNWFGVEAFDVVPILEYEPGHFRTVAFADPTYITETMEAACDALQWGTMRWLLMGRHDPDLLRQATAEIFERMPRLDGTPRSGVAGE